MKTKLFLLVTIFFILYSCKSGISISEIKVPYSKVCGPQGKYECRATGIGGVGAPLYRNYSKERPSGVGKTSGFNYANLGRTVDNVAFNNPGPIIIPLEKDEVIIDTAKVDYDLKTENITNIIAELDASLKKNNVSASASADIKAEFKKKLNDHLQFEAYIITYTIDSGIKDKIVDAHLGTNTEQRFVNAAKKLENGNINSPFVREVKCIYEKCKYSENKDIDSILEPILKGNMGGDDAKVNAVLNVSLQSKKTSLFNSQYTQSTIYSYGYWSDSWMYKG